MQFPGEHQADAAFSKGDRAPGNRVWDSKTVTSAGTAKGKRGTRRVLVNTLAGACVAAAVMVLALPARAHHLWLVSEGAN
jgi:hypothetical protein